MKLVFAQQLHSLLLDPVFFFTFWSIEKVFPVILLSPPPKKKNK